MTHLEFPLCLIGFSVLTAMIHGWENCLPATLCQLYRFFPALHIFHVLLASFNTSNSNKIDLSTHQWFSSFSSWTMLGEILSSVMCLNHTDSKIPYLKPYMLLLISINNLFCLKKVALSVITNSKKHWKRLQSYSTPICSNFSTSSLAC